MAIPKQEFERSNCQKKSESRSYGLDSVELCYHICHPCRQRLKQPRVNCTELCYGAPHGRCPSMKEEEATLSELFSELHRSVQTSKSCSLAHIDDTLELFKTSISREWECSECKYWEAPKGGGYEKAWITTHGLSATNMQGAISGFCGYFIIRKCWMSENEIRKCYTVLSKLADFLATKGCISLKEKKGIKTDLRRFRSINREKIAWHCIGCTRMGIGSHWRPRIIRVLSKTQRTLMTRRLRKISMDQKCHYGSNK